MPRHALLIEDSPADARKIVEMLNDADDGEFDLECANTLASGIQKLSTGIPEAVLLKLDLPDSCGLETFTQLHGKFPQVPVAVLAGLNDDELATQAVRAGAQDFLLKGRTTGSALARVLRYSIERQRGEEALRQASAYNRSLIEASLDPLVTVDPSGKISDTNRATELVTGFAKNQLIGTDFSAYFTEPKEAQAAYRIAFREGSVHDYELELRHHDGHITPVLYNASVFRNEAGKVVGIVATARDISSHRRAEKLEEQLAQAQKMEAIGLLAGGVAHDFNNLLTVINGYSDLLLKRLNPGHGHYKGLTEIRNAGQRAASLTRQLLAFSRRQILSPQVLDLNTVLFEMQTMLRRLIREDIHLEILMQKELGVVRADPSQIEQIVLNLAVNARDAMTSAGSLTIETRNLEVNEGDAREHVQVRPGHYVTLTVSDTGVGMDAETQKRIFEPFFTTKGKDQGTGLGLSIVYGIVSQSDGSIEVSSQPGQGTTFTIYLPRIDDPEDTANNLTIDGSHPPSANARSTGDVLANYRETILLVEDETAVRSIVRLSLESMGYRVLEASNGAEAIAMAQSHAGLIDVLITDVIMPGMGGKQLAEALSAVRPEMKILFISGYTDDDVLRHGDLGRGAAIIQKPFTAEMLSQRVRDTLA